MILPILPYSSIKKPEFQCLKLLFTENHFFHIWSQKIFTLMPYF